MKTLPLFLACFIYSISCTAQIDAFFKKHQNDAEVEYVQMDRDQLFSEFKIDKEEKLELEKLTHSLDMVQYMIASQNIHSLYKDAHKQISKLDYEALVDIKSGDERIKGYILEKNDIIQEWLLLIKSDHDFILGRIKGEFKMSDFGEVLSSFQGIKSCSPDKDIQAESVPKNLKSEKSKVISGFEVFPNPITDNQQMTIRFSATEDISEVTLMVTDLSGKSLFSQKTSLAKGQQELNLSLNKIDIKNSFIVSLVKNDQVLSKVIIAK